MPVDSLHIANPFSVGNMSGCLKFKHLRDTMYTLLVKTSGALFQTSYFKIVKVPDGDIKYQALLTQCLALVLQKCSHPP